MSSTGTHSQLPTATPILWFVQWAWGQGKAGAKRHSISSFENSPPIKTDAPHLKIDLSPIEKRVSPQLKNETQFQEMILYIKKSIYQKLSVISRFHL